MRKSERGTGDPRAGPSVPRSAFPLPRSGDPMKSHTHYLWFNTKRRQEIIDITDAVAEQVRESGIQERFALVSAMHITASVFVNDHESGLWADILKWLEETVAPWDPGRYRHNETGEDNAAAHLRSLTIGHEVIVPVTDGKLDFGPWQRVFYGEWDGQRKKRVIVKVVGEGSGRRRSDTDSRGNAPLRPSRGTTRSGGASAAPPVRFRSRGRPPGRGLRGRTIRDSVAHNPRRTCRPRCRTAPPGASVGTRLTRRCRACRRVSRGTAQLPSHRATLWPARAARVPDAPTGP